MKNLFLLFFGLFILFIVSVAAANNPPSPSSGTIDLNPDEHSFELDTIIVSPTTKTVVYNVYRNGVKQQRKVSVLVDYESVTNFNSSRFIYNRFAMLTPQSNVVVKGFVNNKELKELWNYPFVYNALELCHIKTQL